MENDETIDIENRNENDDKDAKDLRCFLIDLLTELEALKNFIYQGQDIPAYRNLQKISDKIKEKIRED